MSLLGALGLSALGGIFESALSAGTSAISAAQNWNYRKKEMALQQQYAVENYERQLADQERLLDEQRAYDSPLAVAERYRAGGISPLAAFGGSVVGQTAMSSVPSVAAPSASGSYGQTISSPDLLKFKKSLADVEKTEAETAGVLLDNEIKDIEKGIKNATSGAQIMQAFADLEKAQYEAQKAGFESSVEYQTELLNKMREESLKAAFDRAIAESGVKLSKKELEKIDKEIQRAIDANRITKAQASEAEYRESMKEVTYWIDQAQKIVATVSDAIQAVTVVGAIARGVKHFFHKKGVEVPDFDMESYNKGYSDGSFEVPGFAD